MQMTDQYMEPVGPGAGVGGGSHPFSGALSRAQQRSGRSFDQGFVAHGFS